MGKQANNGLLTTTKGCVLEAVRVTFGAAGAPTLVDDGRSGCITSITRLATGRYQVQLEKPYWAKLLTCIPQLTAVNAATALQHARYLEGNYSAAAGTFEVDVSATDTAPAAADPVSGSGMHLLLVFQRLTNI